MKDYFLIKNPNDSNVMPKINWKYIWKNYCLMFNDQKLLDNKKLLKDYSISNRCELNFYRFKSIDKNDK